MASKRCFIDALRASKRAVRTPTPPNGRRASIACVFRTVRGDEQVLFIRRQVSQRDPWSGNVALPGGRQELADGDDDERTAMREAAEEVGLDLCDSSSFEPLGRLVSDRVIWPRGRPMVICMFGFVARDTECLGPALEIQPSEVANAWWVDTRLLRAERLGWRFMDVEQLVMLRDRPTMVRVLRSVGIRRMQFAAIDLPPPPDASMTDDPTNYQLWGLTLAFFSDLLRQSTLAQPLVGPGAPKLFQDAYGPANATALAIPLFKVMECAVKPGAFKRAAVWVGAAAVVVVLAASKFVGPH